MPLFFQVPQRVHVCDLSPEHVLLQAGEHAEDRVRGRRARPRGAEVPERVLERGGVVAHQGLHHHPRGLVQTWGITARSAQRDPPHFKVPSGGDFSSPGMAAC